MKKRTILGLSTAILSATAGGAMAFEFEVSGDVTLQYKIDEATPGLSAAGVVNNFDEDFSELRFDLTVEGGHQLNDSFSIVAYFDAIDFTFEEIEDGDVAYGVGVVTPVGLFQVRTGLRNGDEAPLGFEIEEAEYLYGIQYKDLTAGIAYAPEYGQTRVQATYQGRTGFAGANGYEIRAEVFDSDLDGFETLAESVNGWKVGFDLQFDDLLVGAGASYLKGEGYLNALNTQEERIFEVKAEYEVTSKLRLLANYSFGNSESSALAFAELPTAGNTTASNSGYLTPAGLGSFDEDFSTIGVGVEYEFAENALLRLNYKKYDDVIEIANDEEDGAARGLLRRTNGDVFDFRITYTF